MAAVQEGVHTVPYSNRQDEATKQTKLTIFLCTVGPRVNDMYETLRFEEGEDKTKWSVVSGKLDNACARRTSKHVTWDKFLQLQQEQERGQLVVSCENKYETVPLGGCKMTSF